MRVVGSTLDSQKTLSGLLHYAHMQNIDAHDATRNPIFTYHDYYASYAGKGPLVLAFYRCESQTRDSLLLAAVPHLVSRY